MASKILKIIIVFLFLLSPFHLAVAAEQSDIIINEIAWMGTEVSYNDEWIELYNNSNHFVNLEGWKLEAEGKSPKINLKGKIPSKGFFLLERTNDETVPDIKADLIYKGGLNNKGEHLNLIDNQGKVADEVDCFSGWFAGNNKTKKTMERINFSKSGDNSKNWQTSKNPGGTPKTENSKPPKVQKKETASIGEKTAKLSLWYQYFNKASLNVFLISLAIAIFSAIIILILKKAVTKEM